MSFAGSGTSEEQRDLIVIDEVARCEIFDRFSRDLFIEAPVELLKAGSLWEHRFLQPPLDCILAPGIELSAKKLTQPLEVGLNSSSTQYRFKFDRSVR